MKMDLKNSEPNRNQYSFAKRISLVFFAILTFSSCVNKKEDIYSLYFKKEDLSEVATDVDLLYSDSSIVQLRVRGPKMIRYIGKGENREEFPEGLQVTFFDKLGNEKSWLSAKYGIRFPAEAKIILRDSVVMHNTDQETLKTSELIWFEQTGNMETRKFVEISRPGEIIRGFGLKADENLTRYEINAVTGRIAADDITSDFQ
jgi:LPS export ABC transporter protein LptC